MLENIRLVLARHGEVDANREMRYLGRGDPGLNSTGVGQAEALATTLAELRIDAVIASPMIRTRTTAEAIAGRLGLSVRTELRLREMDFGEWEGLTRADIVGLGDDAARKLLSWERDPSMAPPQGESMAAVQARAVDVVMELTRTMPGRTIALVSHVGPLKALLCTALGLPLMATRRIFLDPATVSVVDWGEPPVIRLLNSPAGARLSGARWLRPSG
jgi:ribonuclease H / adenosylcobalamin/alpha-ribazole phosphatase